MKKILEGGKPRYKKDVLVVVAVRVQADTTELYDDALDTVLGRIADAADERMGEDSNYASAEAKILNLKDVQAAFDAAKLKGDK